MLRGFVGVIVGLVVMVGFVFATFTGAYVALGADGAFKPGGYEASTVWVAIALAISLVAAVLGGFVCRAISKSGTPAVALAVVVLILGLAPLALQGTLPDSTEPPPERTAQTPMLTAMEHAKEPVWLTIANPIIGVVGVMIGSRRPSRKAAA